MQETPVQKVTRYFSNFDYETCRALQVIGNRLAWRGLRKEDIFTIWAAGFEAVAAARPEINEKLESEPLKTPNVRAKPRATAWRLAREVQDTQQASRGPGAMPSRVGA